MDTRAGRLLAETRTAAGLTQAEVARRAGVPQSMVSAYESGTRQPTVPVLDRLLEATGHELALSAPALPAALAGLSGPVGRSVRRHRARLLRLAARRGVGGLQVFGRVARGEEAPGERLDLLVEGVSTRVELLLLAAEIEEVLAVGVNLVPLERLSASRLAALGPELVGLDV